MEDGSQTRIDPINFSCGSRIFFGNWIDRIVV